MGQLEEIAMPPGDRTGHSELHKRNVDSRKLVNTFEKVKFDKTLTKK